jgi:3-hydroxyacyl-CoA dehydrogenase
MEYENKLKDVSVLGAAGKMGSGILLLTAVEMTNLSLKSENRSQTFVVHAIDMNYESLKGLMNYVRTQATKIAEKNIVALRKAYQERKDLVENQDIIRQYVNDVTDMVKPSARLEDAYDSELVFEAVNENPDLKMKLFSQINGNSSTKPWFLTNTSSIPIKSLNEKTGLEGRIIGFHFYNPPAVQKLVEIIPAKATIEPLKEFAFAYAKALRKVVVVSNDVAGFIGNGHFMRDALFGIRQAEQLAQKMPLHEAVYQVNKVTQDFLIRPMGIFQLIDYVGIDVMRYILSVMNPHFEESLYSVLLDNLFDAGIKGGQNPDGSQKDGFLKYEKNKPVATYSLEKNTYIPFDNFSEKADKEMGALPTEWVPWKAVIKDQNKARLLETYFKALHQSDSLGAGMAISYGRNSKAIGKQLVDSGVAQSDEDVNTVLMTGFFHAYGPINSYFDSPKN